MARFYPTSTASPPLNPRCMGRERRVECVRERKILQEEHVRLKNLVAWPGLTAATIDQVFAAAGLPGR